MISAMATRKLTETECLKWIYSYDSIPLTDPPEKAEEKLQKALARLFPGNDTYEHDQSVSLLKMLEVLPTDDGKHTFAHALSLCQNLADVDEFICAIKRLLDFLRAKGRPSKPFGFDTNMMTAPDTLANATPFSKDVPCFEELTSSRDPLKNSLFKFLKRKFEHLLKNSTSETAGKEDERIFEDLSEQKPVPSISEMDSPMTDTPDTETSSRATHSNDVVSRSAAYSNGQDEFGLNSAAKTPSDPAERRQAYLMFFALLRSQQKASIPIICWEREYSLKHPVLRSCADENVPCANLEITHIIPFSSSTFPDDACFKSKNETWFFLLRLFPHLRGRILTNLHINCLENILLMPQPLHGAFNRFDWALHQTEITDEYDVKSYTRCETSVIDIFDQIGWKVKFTKSDLKRLPVPHPDLLALHAAIAQVVHLKGFGEETEQPFEDSDDDCCFGLATDGSTDVERLLAATVLPALEANTNMIVTKAHKKTI